MEGNYWTVEKNTYEYQVCYIYKYVYTYTYTNPCPRYVPLIIMSPAFTVLFEHQIPDTCMMGQGSASGNCTYVA